MPRPLIDLSGIDLDSTQVDNEGLRAVNAQRGAMEHLDAIVRYEPEEGWAVGRRDVGEDEFWVEGHFPGRPLLPGVLMVESAAQLCSFVSNKVLEREGQVLLFAGIEKARFRGAVRPGDRMTVVAVARKIKRRMIRFDSQVLVGDEIVFDGTILGIPS